MPKTSPLHETDVVFTTIRRIVAKRYPKRQDQEDLIHDIWIVVTERTAGDVHWQAAVHRKDMIFIESKIHYLIMKYVQESERDLLYQRVRQALHDAPHIGYHTQGHHASFGDPAGPIMPSYTDLVSRGWNPRTSQTGSIDKATTIVAIAQSFAEQVRDVLGFMPSIPVRELCTFLRQHYDTSIYDRHTDSIEKEDDDTPGVLDTMGTTVDYEVALTHNRLDAIVDHAVRCLGPKEALVLCYLEHCGLRMEAAARAMGYAGASGIARLKERALTALRGVMELYAGLGADDLDRHLFDQFRFRLFHTLCRDVDCHPQEAV